MCIIILSFFLLWQDCQDYESIEFGVVTIKKKMRVARELTRLKLQRGHQQTSSSVKY